MDYKIVSGSVTAPKGFLASGIHCGIKKNSLKKDLALIFSQVPCVACGVYTKNKVKGAPIYITKDHLSNKKARAIICNSGNANTCNGEDGLIKAKKMAKLQAQALNLKTDEVLVASTGVIGVPLNIDAIKNSIPLLTEMLSKEGATNATEAIMTTDTYPKELAIELDLKGTLVTIGATCKGSGMIEPNMGTMLSFITTDANIPAALLDEALKESVALSYNRVSVDGDTSTNDMVLILANGEAKNTAINKEDGSYAIFVEALNYLNIHLSKLIAKDGEGATKLIECKVSKAPSTEDAEALAKSVIKSSLVKTALFGSDANWGRILCALGYANIDFNPEKVDVSFISKAGTIKVCGQGSSIEFNEDLAKEILLEDEILIDVDLNMGDKEATCYGCDLTYDYVKINGDYRS